MMCFQVLRISRDKDLALSWSTIFIKSNEAWIIQLSDLAEMKILWESIILGRGPKTWGLRFCIQHFPGQEAGMVYFEPVCL